MKNILILHNSLNYNKSGVERVSFLLKEELLSRGYNCFEGCIKVKYSSIMMFSEYNFNNSRKHVLEYLSLISINTILTLSLFKGIFDPNINYTVAYLKRNKSAKLSSVFIMRHLHTREKSLSIPEQVKIFLWYLLKFHNVILIFANTASKCWLKCITSQIDSFCFPTLT